MCSMAITSGLVSVIIPCFNSPADLFRETLDSVAAQTYPYVEVLIVDDGSTDPAATAFLSTLTDDPAIRLLRTQHGGPAIARNLAAEAARGEFLLPLDSDDLIAPGYLALAVAAMTENAEASVVYGLAEYVGDRSGPINLPTYSRRDILTTNPLYATCLIRRSSFDAVGGYDPEMVLGLEDHELWLRLCGRFGAPVRLPETVFFYRIRQGSRNGAVVADRRAWVAARSRMFQNNIGLYAEFPDVLFEQLEAAESELAYWKGRYWQVDRWAQRLPGLSSLVHRTRRRGR